MRRINKSPIPPFRALFQKAPALPPALSVSGAKGAPDFVSGLPVAVVATIAIDFSPLLPEPWKSKQNNVVTLRRPTLAELASFTPELAPRFTDRAKSVLKSDKADISGTPSKSLEAVVGAAYFLSLCTVPPPLPARSDFEQWIELYAAFPRAFDHVCTLFIEAFGLGELRRMGEELMQRNDQSDNQSKGQEQPCQI